MVQDIFIIYIAELADPTNEGVVRYWRLLTISRSVSIHSEDAQSYSSGMESMYVLGAYTRRSLRLSTKKAVTRTTNWSKDGIRVAKNAAADEGEFRWLPSLEFF